MEQGTTEWLQWRRQGIGASESAALLGVCPYKTAYQLWVEKTGGHAEGMDENLARRGHETEALVRAEYEFTTGLEFSPALFEHPEFPFIRASLDGWNEAERRGIEIKFMGAEKFEQPIPPHHIIQVQHQMLVTATDSWTYLRHNDGRTKVEVITASPHTQSLILGACWKFWDQVGKREAPEFSPRDWVPSDSESLKSALVAMSLAQTTAERSRCRLEVLRHAKFPKTICDGVKITLTPPRVTFPKES